MKYESVEEINTITVDDVIIELMSRLLDLSVIPLGTNFYNLLPAEDGVTLYERIQVHILLVKPTVEELEAELIDYKVEILADFDVNAAENERVAALKARFQALPDMRIAMGILGLDVPNLKAYARDIIESKDNTLLENLEAVNSQVQDILDAQTQDVDDTEAIKQLIRDFDVSTVDNTNAVQVLKNVIRALQKTIAR